MALQQKSKSEIERDLKLNPFDARYIFYKHEKGQSKVWANYELIKFEGVTINYVRCIWCKNILTYLSKTGTASLLRHKCAILTSMKDDASLPVLDKLLEDFPEKDSRKFDLVDKQLLFLSRDLRPLDTIEGDGFIELAQALIDFGAEYNRQDVRTILTTPKTLSAVVIPATCNKIKIELDNILNEKQVSFAVDLWASENQENRSYFLTLSVHFLNENMHLQKFVLGTREHNQEPDGIRTTVLEILKDYGGEKKLTKGTIVTENSERICETFSSYTRINCACQLLNLSINKVIENEAEVGLLVGEANKLVSYFKESHLEEQLSNPLKRLNSKKWHCVYITLKSIIDVFEELKTLLSINNESFRLNELDFNVIASLVEFLSLFAECSLQLSSVAQPTINQIPLWEKKLLSHCEIKEQDNNLIKEIKSQLSDSLKKAFKAQDLHYVALFLDPNFKSMKFLSDSKRENVKCVVVSMMKTIVDEEGRPNEFEEFIPEKKFKLDESLASCSRSYFLEFQDSCEDDLNSEDWEIETYLKKRVASNTCPLLFWQSVTDLPILKRLATRVLSIPASSSLEEQVFSEEAKMLVERRTSLRFEEIDMLIFLHSNFNLNHMY